MQASLAPVELQPSPAPPGQARVLLVDDDERNLMALSHALENVAEVVTATSGRDALRHLLHGDFAVVLLDVFMPGMDGFELAQLIKQRQRCQHTPIIFLTGAGSDITQIYRGYSVGAVDYLSKPVDADVVRAPSIPYHAA